MPPRKGSGHPRLKSCQLYQDLLCILYDFYPGLRRLQKLGFFRQFQYTVNFYWVRFNFIRSQFKFYQNPASFNQRTNLNLVEFATNQIMKQKHSVFQDEVLACPADSLTTQGRRCEFFKYRRVCLVKEFLSRDFEECPELQFQQQLLALSDSRCSFLIVDLLKSNPEQNLLLFIKLATYCSNFQFQELKFWL